MLDNCINVEKLNRAKQAVLVAPRPDSAEAKALSMGRAEKLEGDDLVEFVYKTIGGLMLEEAPEAVQKVVKAKKAKR